MMDEYFNIQQALNGYRRRFVVHREENYVHEVVGTTPLHLAMFEKNDSFALVKEHLRNGVHPDIKSKSGETALNKGIALNRVEAIGALLEHGAKVDIRNARGNTPLHLALLFGFNIDIVNKLCSAGATFTLVNNRGDTPLHAAIQNKLSNARVIKSILKRDVQIDARNEKGRTALIEAAFRSKPTSIVEALVKHGADVNILDARGHSALHYAISYKDVNTAKVLLKYGASPCSQNLQCCFSDENSVFLLIQHLTLHHFEISKASHSQSLVWEKVLADLKPSIYFSFNKLKEMFSSCFQELDDMKSDFLRNDFTMYNFVHNRLSMNAFQYPEPGFIIELAASRLSAGRFKNYLNLVFNNLNKRELSRCLSTQFISSDLPCGRNVVLSADSLLSICNHLSKQDVRNVLTACVGFYEQ